MLRATMSRALAYSHRKTIVTVIGLALVLAASGAAAAEIPNERRFPEKFLKLSTELVTPHVAWAKPLAGGPIKALVIGARWTQRETVELMERLDVQCTLMLTQNAEDLYTKGRFWGHELIAVTHQDAVLRDFKEKLKGNYDVIILGQAPVKDFPPEIVEELLAKVRAGTGIVWFSARIPKGRPNVVPDKLTVGLLADSPPQPSPLQSPAPQSPPVQPRGKQPAEYPVTASDQQQWQRLAAVLNGIPFQKIGVFPRDYKKNCRDAISLGECGKGRVAMVHYFDIGGYTGSYCGGLLTANDPVDLDYEYQMSFVAKCLLWAARREGATRLTGLPEPLTWRVLDGGERSLQLSLEHQGPPLAAEVSLAVRTAQDLFRLPVSPLDRPGVEQTQASIDPVYQESSKVSLESGRKELSFRLPALPAGDYFADVQVKGAGGVLDWGTVPLTVQPACEITRIASEPEVVDFRRADAGQMTVVVEWRIPRLAAGQPLPHLDKPALSVAVLDTYNGLLAQSRLSPNIGAGSARAVLALPRPATSLLKVRVELTAAGQPVTVRTEYVHVIGRPWDDYTYFAWAGPGHHYIGRQVYRTVASLGVDAFRGRTTTAALLQADIRCVSDITHFGSKVVKNVVVPCYNDPQYRDTLRQLLTKAIQGVPAAAGAKTVKNPNLPGSEKQIDCFAYMFGDEFQFTGGGLKGTCTCPHCLPLFRQFVARLYGDIAALNKEWGSSYASFEAIVPGVGGTIDGEAAMRRGNYAPLLDQWLFNYDSFVGAIASCRDVLRQEGSRARLGPSTPLWNYYYRGYAWSEIMKVCDFATPYGPASCDFSDYEPIRSFARPDTVFGGHFGSYVEPILNDEDHFRMLPYMVLFDGGANTFWYAIGGNEGGTSPWIDPYPCLLRTSEEVAHLKDGIARLLLGARRQSDGIAVHSSISSHLFSFLADRPEPPVPKVSFRMSALLQGLWQSGYASEMLSTEQILSGGLKHFKALILPNSESIGDAEAAKIEAFVKAGGLVIADMRPGVADEHGRLRPSATMAGLFGVEWTYPLAAVSDPKTGRYAGAYQGSSFAAPGTHTMDPSLIKIGSAQLLKSPEGVPLMTVNRHGQGTAICGVPFSAEADPPFIGNLLQAILAAHGIRSWATIRDREPGYEPGAILPGLKCTRLLDGRICYAGSVRTRQFKPSDARGGELSIAFPAKGHVYDVPRGNLLGRTRATGHPVAAVGLPLAGVAALQGGWPGDRARRRRFRLRRHDPGPYHPSRRCAAERAPRGTRRRDPPRRADRPPPGVQRGLEGRSRLIRDSAGSERAARDLDLGGP